MSDKKDAVKIGITISIQIITASLTMIAVIGAFVVFIIDKREVGTAYYIITGFAFLSLVYSVFLGGKGIDKIRNNGFSGEWEISSTKQIFNRQACTALLGILLFCASVFMGEEKNIHKNKNIDNQQKQINDLRKIISNKLAQDSMNINEIVKLKSNLLETQNELIKLKNSSEPIPQTSINK